MIIFMALAIILLKAVVAGSATLFLGMPIRTAVICRIGFSANRGVFLRLAKSGAEYHIASEYHYQLFLAVSLLTMALTPTLISWAPLLENWSPISPFFPAYM